MATTTKLTGENELERTLHDEFYGGLGLTDSQLQRASAPDRLKLYRENPDREWTPKQYQFYLLGDLTGMTVCDYACGDGADAVLLAANGARFIRAFDISNSAVEIVRRRARLCGIEAQLEVRQDNAEQLSYEANSFDAIYGSSVLHHLDIEKAAREVHRVLKPGGRAVFREPYEQSRLLAGIIKLIFRVSSLKPDAVSPQRQLNEADVVLLASIFSRVNVKAFGLFNRVDRILKNTTVVENIGHLDALLLKNVPFLRTYARHIVIECIK